MPAQLDHRLAAGRDGEAKTTGSLPRLDNGVVRTCADVLEVKLAAATKWRFVSFALAAQRQLAERGNGIADGDRAGDGSDLANWKLDECAAAIRRSDRLLHRGHFVAERNVAVFDAETISVVRKKIGNQELAVRV